MEWLIETLTALVSSIFQIFLIWINILISQFAFLLLSIWNMDEFSNNWQNSCNLRCAEWENIQGGVFVKNLYSCDVYLEASGVK